MLICDHASRRMPRSLGTLGISEADLERHIGYDIGSRDVALMISERTDAPLVMTHYSRLIVDPNRHPGTPSSIPLASEDVVIPGNHDLSPADVNQREEEFFWPYHSAVDTQIERFRQSDRIPAIVSIHSFTPAFLGFERPWHIGVLWHRDPRVARPLLDRLEADPTICVGDNEPYSARNPEGYTIEAHADGRGYPNVLVEVRQDLIDDAAGIEKWGNYLTEALSRVLAEPSIYRVEMYQDVDNT
jgi:predicted N-formylglutamate amidohydrolase